MFVSYYALCLKVSMYEFSYSDYIVFHVHVEKEKEVRKKKKKKKKNKKKINIRKIFKLHRIIV